MLLDANGQPINLEPRQPSDKSSETIGPQDQAPIDLAPGKASIVPQIGPTPIAAEPANEGSEDRTPKWKKRLEFSAAGIAIGLLLVNIFQLSATKNAADAAKRGADTARQKTT
jgi:hypothetical protein